MNEPPIDHEPPDRAPKLVTGGQGDRHYSLAALQERIEAQFMAETDPLLLREADTDAARRDLIREAVDYVLATEVVTLSRPERMALIDALYSNIFKYGPLDTFIEDESVTELSIDGADKLFVRHGADDQQPVSAFFEDDQHLARILTRTLDAVGSTYGEETPFVEVGTTLLGRRARVTVAAPPISPVLHVDIRLHPTQPFTLDDLVTRGFITRAAADGLPAALRTGRGLMLAGDVGTGKTTLLNALLHYLPGQSAVVQRAAELHIPPDMVSYSGGDFAGQIETALATRPPWLVLDEVRFDESRALLAVLSADTSRQPRPRLLWVFRGATDAGRLRAAFGMSLRRAAPLIESRFITDVLVDQLPLVITTARRASALRVIGLGEWVRDTPDGETASIHPLIES